MDLNIIQIILVIIIAFLAGMGGILDEFQFHQPLVACTLIGLVTGNLIPCLILGGSLQMIALGWANIGAAVAPDAALASVAAAIILVLSGEGQAGISSAIAIAIPLAVAGLLLTIICRTIATAFVHLMDAAAKEGNIRKVEMWHFIAILMQGVRIALPAALILLIGAGPISALLASMPAWLTDGLAVGGGMVVAVGYAMVINMMATKEVWPFFAIGFVLATIPQLTLIGLGAIGVALALIYLALSKKGGSGNGGSNIGDPVGDISIDTKKGEKTKMEKNLKLTKKDRLSIWWRSTFIQGSWNYERMQNGGWAFSLIPAIKKLYKTKEERSAALTRHLEFFNTHPYVASPIIGVTLALEEDRANGAQVDDVTIQGVKVGMMGPLAGIGDPVFWFTVRPILGALGASLAMAGNILGPIIFFLGWNIIRMAFTWYTQEFGYKAGSRITEDLSGNLLQDITKGASILGMFILGSLVNRWVSIKFAPVVSTVQLSPGAYIDWNSLPAGAEGIKEALLQQSAGLSLTAEKVTTLQGNLDSLIPGLAGLLLTFLCMWLLKKKVSPIVIILALFVIGIVFHVIGLM